MGPLFQPLAGLLRPSPSCGECWLWDSQLYHSQENHTLLTGVTLTSELGLSSWLTAVEDGKGWPQGLETGRGEGSGVAVNTSEPPLIHPQKGNNTCPVCLYVRIGMRSKQNNNDDYKIENLKHLRGLFWPLLSNQDYMTLPHTFYPEILCKALWDLRILRCRLGQSPQEARAPGSALPQHKVRKSLLFIQRIPRN